MPAVMSSEMAIKTARRRLVFVMAVYHQIQVLSQYRLSGLYRFALAGRF